MEHRVREEAGSTVVCLTGEVDLEKPPLARNVLLSAVSKGSNVLVDLSDVAYIDSSGVASLVEAFQNARRRGSSFALVSVSAAVRRVLELARLDRVFTIHATLREGLDVGS